VKIGVTCFSTFGGSSQVASELALGLAARGHALHIIAKELPVRLRGPTPFTSSEPPVTLSERSESKGSKGSNGPAIRFHEVTESTYPALAGSSAYPIALASKMIEVASAQQLDVLHVHYAVPHATAAWMAREVMGPSAPRLVVTLHGTDITLVGAAPNHLAITRHSIEQCDAVTVPSAHLRDETRRLLGVADDVPIHVIPNFVDGDRFSPRGDAKALDALFPAQATGPVLVHVSNFRPVKRLADVIAVAAKVNAKVPCRLLLIGDGPERAAAEQAVDAAGLRGRTAFTGEVVDTPPLLGASDVFLLPSEQESFGLAALEAMACGTPVVASNVGGLPEVVRHGRDGFLAPLGDIDAMAAHALAALAAGPQLKKEARGSAVERFSAGPAIDAYEALYRSLTSSLPSTRPAPSRRRP
jgi:L-malate glycosyltransferase